MSAYRPLVALALRVWPPRQGSGLAASLVPRSSLHESDGSTPTEPQALRMLDEPSAPISSI